MVDQSWIIYFLNIFLVALPSYSKSMRFKQDHHVGWEKVADWNAETVPGPNPNIEVGDSVPKLRAPAFQQAGPSARTSS